MVIFTARQNLANLNEVKMNLIVKFANLAGKSYSKYCWEKVDHSVIDEYKQRLDEILGSLQYDKSMLTCTDNI